MIVRDATDSERGVSKDHVHILVSAPPNMAPGEIMRRIMGNTSSRLFNEFAHLEKEILHSQLLGVMVLLCDGRGDGGGDGQAVS